MKRWICLTTLLAWLAASLPGFAIGLIVVPPQEKWLPHRPPDQPRIYAFAPLEMTHAHVDVHITDQVATTKVDQEFYNPGPVRLEGTFLFPLPAGAHVDKFTMEIDGRPASAELLAADKASGIYEDIVRRLRDPALLEYSGRDLLKLRVYPIEPGGHKRITLTYTELLQSDGGLVSYTLPLNAGKFSAAPIRNVSVKVRLETTRSRPSTRPATPWRSGATVPTARSSATRPKMCSPTPISSSASPRRRTSWA
jgi:Ca-activated chloride channel family protein